MAQTGTSISKARQGSAEWDFNFIIMDTFVKHNDGEFFSSSQVIVCGTTYSCLSQALIERKEERRKFLQPNFISSFLRPLSFKILASSMSISSHLHLWKAPLPD